MAPNLCLHETVYDLASITKVAVTANLLMQRAGNEELDVDWSLDQIMPQLQDHPLGTRTVREWLTHQTGLEAWIPFYQRALDDSSGVFGTEATDGCAIAITDSLFLEDVYLDSVRAMILSAELKPAGEYKYSDLGFYLLHDALEGAGVDVAQWVQDEMVQRMGWTSMGYNPLERGVSPDRIAPTEIDLVFRQGEVRGTVHDPGAAMREGKGCHAGLFSNAYDLAELGETWLRGASWADENWCRQRCFPIGRNGASRTGTTGGGWCLTNLRSNPTPAQRATWPRGRALATPDSLEPWYGWTRRTIWCMCF